MTLTDEQARLIDAHLSSESGLAAVGLGLCWPNRSPFESDASVYLDAGETLFEAADRLDLSWSPQWLRGAGFRVVDAEGSQLVGEASASRQGEIQWDPPVRLGKLDDQTPDTAAGQRRGRRLRGEIAVLALWQQACRANRIELDPRPEADLSGGTRGARFRDVLVHTLRRSVPDGWRVEHEVPLTSIRGLHMRRGVGERKSDIVVIDDANRLIAVISSKWTWRSDRGTEAAQMVPLRQYRPDVPYVLMTAEFPRIKVVARESVEDRSYHLCPQWVGAWLAVTDSENARTEFPDLESLQRAGTRIADSLGITGLHDLVHDLREISTIL